ncbi:hypothetical protein K449DRAFT_418524 [Hypoxylon sp. EC38]|nr:hypothetical protein K449DRAFT_418524 [Hypoxylon sp. EC38]
MSQLETGISPTSAWIAVRDELRNRLSEANVNGRLNVTGITSMPATGKSTTMVSYIIQLARESRVPERVIYVIPDSTERLLLSKWLIQNGGVTAQELGDGRLASKNKVTLSETRDFLQYLRAADGSASQAVTLLIDISWYPTVEEELMFAELVEWGRQRMNSPNCRTAIVLLMSVFESQRTMDLLRDSFGLEYIRGLTFPSLHIWPKAEALPPNWSMSMSNRMRQVMDEGGRVIHTGIADFLGYSEIDVDELFLPQTGVLQDPATFIVGELNSASMISLCEPLCYSTEFSRLRLFLSRDTTESPEMDARAFQWMIKSRKLEGCELIRHKSWVVKSDSIPGHVKFLTTYSATTVPPSVTPKVESFGPAWNADLLATVLSLVNMRGGRFLSQMNIRRVPNQLFWAEGLRRLYILGCLERDQVFGTYRASNFGASVCQAILDYQVNFHVAYLLSMARLEPDLVVKKVLIRMAALFHIQPRRFLSFDRRQRPTLQEMRDACAPLVRNEVQSGYIWQALGVYLALDNGLPFAQRKEDGSGDIGKFTYYPGEGIHAQLLVERLELHYGIIQGDFSWRNGTLSTQQTRAINRALMWSWLHRSVWFPPQPDIMEANKEKGIELVSSMECAVEMRGELIDAPYIREVALRTREQGGIVAIYAELYQHRDGHLLSGILTSIDPDCLNEIKEKTGIEWPEAVMRTN